MIKRTMRFYSCVCENEKSHGNNKLLFFFALLLGLSLTWSIFTFSFFFVHRAPVDFSCVLGDASLKV
jgi:hypothetical protein